jgi:hypothetical protein
MSGRVHASFTLLLATLTAAAVQAAPPPLPEGARLVLEEYWAGETPDPARWYLPRKQWGEGNHGVVPENVAIEEDTVRGERTRVLVCHARGDRYTGPIRGQWNRPDRVGGVIVSRAFFASGRFEVTMKIGDASPQPGGPSDPRRPAGAVPAIWTYGHRLEKIEPALAATFPRDRPLYHPHLQEWGPGMAFHWSEIDFPEFGKAGRFDRPMYNTFLNKQHHSLEFDLPQAADGAYHTYVTEWRTELVSRPELRDEQMAEAEGFWWVRDPAVPWESYWGAPFRRLGPDRFALCAGRVARHWFDGRLVGENTRWVPALSAQLTLGIWLPQWAGPADWASSAVRFAAVRVWQYGDPGDALGVLRDNITDSFDRAGNRLPKG